MQVEEQIPAAAAHFAPGHNKASNSPQKSKFFFDKKKQHF